LKERRNDHGRPFTRFHVGPRLSETAVHNGTVYLAGQVPDDTTAGHPRPDRAGAGDGRQACWPRPAATSRCILMTQIFLADITDITAQ
jgi:enamine deaminase RidA (YjgF/YER057c/UK114 family)